MSSDEDNDQPAYSGQAPAVRGRLAHRDAASRLIAYLLTLHRYVKRAILMALDFSLLAFALWCAYSLRLGVFYVPPSLNLLALQLAAPAIGVISFHHHGVYKLITRFVSSQSSIKIAVSMMWAVLIWSLLVYMTTFTLSSVPRSVIVIYGLLGTVLIWAARHLIAYMLVTYMPMRQKQRAGTVPVLIYGVGDTGRQLADELALSRHYRLVGFLDDNPSSWRQMLSGVTVFNPDRISSLLIRENISEIFLADPLLSRRRKRELLDQLAPLNVKLKTLSTLHEGSEGRVMVSDLRAIGLEDLLGRSTVPPQQPLMDKHNRGKVVMITGGGGSIGSELARQVLALGPAKLVLYEQSEFALYSIELELCRMKRALAARGEIADDGGPEILPLLGCVTDAPTLTRVMQEQVVETVYHAAAYKHVPLVEVNPVAGLENNVFGTVTAANAARAAGVEIFVLISTDKAVRPTNVMGASKRIAELYLQALAAEVAAAGGQGPIFTMVRFGNVLGSSGSVIARFQQQIADGGPVTVTHPEIVRYFMMIPEAAQLVLQAGGMAEGGEVFVLEMGQPVKILDLARSMINLSGLEVADETNPDGDIRIEFTGLRDGEKLYEELLITENSRKTAHPKIIRNQESFMPIDALEAKLALLRSLLSGHETTGLDALLTELVEGYKPGGDDAATVALKPAESREAAVQEEGPDIAPASSGAIIIKQA